MQKFLIHTVLKFLDFIFCQKKWKSNFLFSLNVVYREGCQTDLRNKKILFTFYDFLKRSTIWPKVMWKYRNSKTGQLSLVIRSSWDPENLSPSKRLNIKLYYILYANNPNWGYEDRNLLFQPSNNQNWGYKDRN